MTDLSTVKGEQIVLVDKDTAIRYKVIEEKIDLEALRQEKEEIETRLEQPELTEKELAEYARSVIPLVSKESLQQRIEEIDLLLVSIK